MPKKQAAPRKRPILARSRVTVEAILEATAELLIANGYDALTTNAVALRAGVSIGSLYQYFPSKDALLTALTEKHASDLGETMMAELAAIRPDDPLEDVVRRAVVAMFAMHRVDTELHRVLAQEIPRALSIESVRASDARNLALVESLLAARSDTIVPRNVKLAARLVTTTVSAITHEAVLRWPESLVGDELVEETTALVVRYLTAGGDRSR